MILLSITPNDFKDIDFDDVILEGLALVAYLFVLLMVFYAKKNNKIFASKGFLVLISGIILGTISAFMNFLSEFYWIEPYEVYKLTFVILQIVGLFLFAISLMILFRFTKFLLGDEDIKNSESDS